MSDVKVHFEHLDKPDRIEGLALLLLRRQRLQPHVLVYCANEAQMLALDERLWSITPESFLPHACAGAENSEKQPILLATKVVYDNQPQVLMNAAMDVPHQLEGFLHIVDFVDAWHEHGLMASRERFRTYRHLGWEPNYLKKS